MSGVHSDWCLCGCRFTDSEADERMARLVASIPLGHTHRTCRACDADRAETERLRRRVATLEAERDEIRRKHDILLRAGVTISAAHDTALLENARLRSRLARVLEWFQTGAMQGRMRSVFAVDYGRVWSRRLSPPRRTGGGR
jgi:hypothetical protein